MRFLDNVFDLVIPSERNLRGFFFVVTTEDLGFGKQNNYLGFRRFAEGSEGVLVLGGVPQI